MREVRVCTLGVFVLVLVTKPQGLWLKLSTTMFRGDLGNLPPKSAPG